MLEMIKVPKRAQRLEGMLYKQLLTARQEDMRSMAGLINSACLDVRLSRRLKKLLGIILKLGNQLNEVRRTNRWEYSTRFCHGIYRFFGTPEFLLLHLHHPRLLMKMVRGEAPSDNQTHGL